MKNFSKNPFSLGIKRPPRSSAQVLAEDKPCTWTCDIYFDGEKHPSEYYDVEARSNAEARKLTKEWAAVHFKARNVSRVDCSVSQHCSATVRKSAVVKGPDGRVGFVSR